MSEVAIGHTTEAIALTDNAVDTAWFQSTLKAASAVCYTLGRITFERPDGTPGKSPMRGQCFFYFGTNFAKFAEAFRHIGHVVELNKRAAAPANDAQEEPVGFGDIDAEDVEDALATDVAVPDEPIARGRDEILAFAGRIRAEEAKATREQNKALRQANPLPVVEGKYGTIVIDPPWPIEKIERDVRPNQVAFDYPTMSEQELAAFPVADIAADDCHLFCWTTQKFLPVAFRLLAGSFDSDYFRFRCMPGRG